MTLDYLRELCGIYEEFFRHYDDTPLLILDTDEFNHRSDPDELSRVCDLVMETLNRHISAREMASMTLKRSHDVVVASFDLIVRRRLEQAIGDDGGCSS